MHRLIITVALFFSFVVCALLLHTSRAQAAGTCSVNGGWSFGSYNALTQVGNDNINASVTLTCSGFTAGAAISPIIELSAGNSGNASSRFMSSGANHFAYNIFCTDTNCKPGSSGKVFANGNAGTQHITPAVTANSSGNVNASYQTMATITAGTDPLVTGASTSYTDNLVLSVQF